MPKIKNNESNIINFQTACHFNVQSAKQINLIGKKIGDARRSCKITQKDLAELLSEYGVSVKTPGVCKWESGETVPNSYQLFAICHALEIQDGLAYFMGKVQPRQEELNAEGLRKLEDYRQDLIASGLYQTRTEYQIIKMREMPTSLLPASAGTGNFLDEENMEMKSYPASSIPTGADFAVKVDGDSMEPVYTDGQIAWVQRCEELRPGEVGLFIVDGKGFIKVYEEQEPDKAEWDNYMDSYGVLHPQPVLISYNEKYEPRVITPDMRFYIAGRVLN